MLRSGNIRCGVAAALLVAVSSIQTAMSQVGTQVATDAAQLPDAAGVVSAHGTIRRWVDRLEAPSIDDAASRIEIRNCTGVCIIIRRQGKPIGVGVDAGGDALMVRRAAGRALNHALGDPALARVAAQLQEIANDGGEELTLDDSIRLDLGRRLAVELEAAGRMLPLTGRDLSQLARKVAPGLDGVAVRRAREWTVLFPSQLRTTNQTADADKLMLYLSIQAGVPMKAVGQLDALSDVTYYSFRTVHLAQPAPQRGPMNLTRGDVFTSLGAEPQPRIQQFTDGLARHLLQYVQFDQPLDPEEQTQTQTEPAPPVGIAGHYRSWIDQHDGAASSFEQALVCWALLTYAQLPSGDAELRSRSVDAALGLLQSLEAREPAALDEPATCAMIIYAISAHPNAHQLDPIRQLGSRAAEGVVRSFEPAAGFLQRTPEDAHAAALDLHTQALLAGAMARLLTMPHFNPAMNDSRRVRQAIDAVWHAVAEPQRITMLPWIGWAEADWSTAALSQSPKLDDLKQIIAWLADCRVGSANLPSLPAELDLNGGFALRHEGQTALDQARPTSQSARPAAWIATSLRDTLLVPTANRAGATQQHLETVRFLIQLSVREDCAAQVPNSRRALGGVRTSLWDATHPLPAQALSLVAGVETLRTIGEFPP